MATRGERLELFPAAVYPEVDRTWMMDHVADVLEANGKGMHSLVAVTHSPYFRCTYGDVLCIPCCLTEFGDSQVLSDGCLAVPIRYRSKWIGVFVVSRNKSTSGFGRCKLS
jgi:hypothetical protein